MFQMFILINIQKIKINSEDDFPLEKSVTMLHEIILFKSECFLKNVSVNTI